MDDDSDMLGANRRVDMDRTQTTNQLLNLKPAGASSFNVHGEAFPRDGKMSVASQRADQIKKGVT